MHIGVCKEIENQEYRVGLTELTHGSVRSACRPAPGGDSLAKEPTGCREQRP